MAVTTHYFMREALAQAYRDDLLAAAAERRRDGELPSATTRARLARTLAALATRRAPAPAEAQPAPRAA